MTVEAEEASDSKATSNICLCIQLLVPAEEDQESKDRTYGPATAASDNESYAMASED